MALNVWERGLLRGVILSASKAIRRKPNQLEAHKNISAHTHSRGFPYKCPTAVKGWSVTRIAA